MPWHIEKREDEYCVIKDADGENEGCHPTEEKAKKQLAALYASENRADEQRLPIEMRAASVGSVDFPHRMIDVLAVPYGREAVVEYRGEIWKESFDRGSFAGVETRAGKIKAYRDHDPAGGGKSGLVGRAVALYPDREEGLVGAVHIAKTPLGDETLSLADEGILSVSIGFGVRGSDQVLDRASHRRRIGRAFLDHLAFPDSGAYEDAGAGIMSVRSKRQEAVDLPRLDTPLLDEVVAWMASRRSQG
jgi:phage head maturation protease